MPLTILCWSINEENWTNIVSKRVMQALEYTLVNSVCLKYILRKRGSFWRVSDFPFYFILISLQRIFTEMYFYCAKYLLALLQNDHSSYVGRPCDFRALYRRELMRDVSAIWSQGRIVRWIPTVSTHQEILSISCVHDQLFFSTRFSIFNWDSVRNRNKPHKQSL